MSVATDDEVYVTWNPKRSAQHPLDLLMAVNDKAWSRTVYFERLQCVDSNSIKSSLLES